MTELSQYTLNGTSVPKVALARLNTPLEPLHRFSKKHGLPTIWLKRDDLTDTLASGNKLRKLEFTTGQALTEKATVLVTCGGVQSNHCRATAAVAARLGLKCHLILRGTPESAADGNHMLDQMLGAKITYVTVPEYAEMSSIYQALKTEYEKAGERPYFMPVGATDEVGLWGYISASEELKRDFEDHNITPEYLVSATGSGGTAAGLIAGKHLFNLVPEVLSFNVCDDAAYFKQQINSDFDKWRQRYGIDLPQLDINIIEGYVGQGYGKAGAEIFALINELATCEGIILDPVYTAKAFYGLVTELKAGRLRSGNDIVFIHTGGIFGLFPQKAQLFQNPVV